MEISTCIFRCWTAVYITGLASSEGSTTRGPCTSHYFSRYTNMGAELGLQLGKVSIVVALASLGSLCKII